VAKRSHTVYTSFVMTMHHHEAFVWMKTRDKYRKLLQTTIASEHIICYRYRHKVTFLCDSEGSASLRHRNILHAAVFQRRL